MCGGGEDAKTQSCVEKVYVRTHYHAKLRREGEREGKGSILIIFFGVVVVYVCVCVFKKLDNVKCLKKNVICKRMM